MRAGWQPSARKEGEVSGASLRGIAGRARSDKRRRKPEDVISWVIPEDAKAGGNGILIDGLAGDARFSGNKECIGGSTGEETARREPGGRTDGEAGR